jgi:hypothetical protein
LPGLKSLCRVCRSWAFMGLWQNPGSDTGQCRCRWGKIPGVTPGPTPGLSRCRWGNTPKIRLPTPVVLIAGAGVATQDYSDLPGKWGGIYPRIRSRPGMAPILLREAQLRVAIMLAQSLHCGKSKPKHKNNRSDSHPQSGSSSPGLPGKPDPDSPDTGIHSPPKTTLTVPKTSQCSLVATRARPFPISGAICPRKWRQNSVGMAVRMAFQSQKGCGSQLTLLVCREGRRPDESKRIRRQ